MRELGGGGGGADLTGTGAAILGVGNFTRKALSAGSNQQCTVVLATDHVDSYV